MLMRVFVTGATGGIGSAVVPELIGAGHEVLALARSDASARAARALGADVLPGDLDDPDSLRTGAKESDGVVHLAFLHFDDFEKAVAQEAGAVDAFGAALDGTGKPFVMASGTPPVPGRASTERDAPPTEGPIGGRAQNAHAALELAARGVRSAVVRLPRSVHRAGGPCGFASLLVEAARRTGVSGYVGDGVRHRPRSGLLEDQAEQAGGVEDVHGGPALGAVADVSGHPGSSGGLDEQGGETAGAA
ncbi:3-beta hydroxysteroid dehydrogenase, partial [Mycobacterium sp. E1715]